MMFLKQSIMLSEKRQQFATISNGEIYETLSMIPKLEHIRTYILLMLKQFMKGKHLIELIQLHKQNFDRFLHQERSFLKAHF